MVAVCSRCGATHHEECWQQHGCGSYDCAPASRSPAELPDNSLRVTFDQLESAPLPPPRIPGMSVLGYPTAEHAFFESERSGPPRPTSRTTIAAFVVALLGIPLFGFITGLLAMLLGVIALVGRRPRQRGVVLASLAILIGLADFLGWTFYLLRDHPLMDGGPAMVAEEFELDADDFRDQPPPIARALLSNVLIEVESAGMRGLLGHGLGSGVILDIRDGMALILTNRHVVDPQFHEGGKQAENPGLPTAKVTVKMIGQPRLPGTVLWMAPLGIDLALLNVPSTAKEITQACWIAKPKLQIGSRVFAVGNPHGLGWSHSGGQVSQIRKQTAGLRDVKVIQTTAAINPGNSGGGLYDDEGRLIGINTWTQDKRFAEGLGFAISFQTFLELVPDSFKLPQQRMPPAP